MALACTLSRDVEVAFLDEPTLGLDVESSRDLRAELRALVRERDLTVVLSSHDVDVVEELLGPFRTQTYRLVVDGVADDTLRDRLAAAYDAAEWTVADGRTRFEVTSVG